MTGHIGQSIAVGKYESISHRWVNHTKVDRVLCGEIQDEDKTDKKEKCRSVIREFLTICKAKNHKPCVIFLWITPTSENIGTYYRHSIVASHYEVEYGDENTSFFYHVKDDTIRKRTGKDSDGKAASKKSKNQNQEQELRDTSCSPSQQLPIDFLPTRPHNN